MATVVGHAPGLTGNQLKILALVAMTADHVGMLLLPQVLWLRLLGRISMPIFAWMIAEGCRYTRSRRRYLAGILGLGVVCQIITFLATGWLYQSILITFSLSLGMIFLWDAAQNTTWGLWAFAVGMAAVFFVTTILPDFLLQWYFGIDYDFFGVMLPLLFYLGRDKKQKLLLGGIGLVALSILKDPTQWFCLFSLPLLALYNGQRGKRKLKYLFYIYYPLHLAALYLLVLFI